MFSVVSLRIKSEYPGVCIVQFLINGCTLNVREKFNFKVYKINCGNVKLLIYAIICSPIIFCERINMLASSEQM